MANKAVIFNGLNSGQNGPGLIAQMLNIQGYSVRFIQEINKKTLENENLLFLPGGDSGKLYKNSKVIDWNYIKEWIKAGGKFCGICAGAYPIVKYVTGYYEGLHIIENVFAYPSEYIGLIDIVFNGKVLPIYRERGGSFQKIAGSPRIIATYKTENKIAIVGDSYGKGRVIACGPHPEDEPKRHEVFKAMLDYLNESDKHFYSFTEIAAGASKVIDFMNKEGREPNYITFKDKSKINMPSFLFLMLKAINQAELGQIGNSEIKEVRPAVKPAGSLPPGKQIPKKEYLNFARNLKDFINAALTVPNSVKTSIGDLNANKFIYTFALILNFYNKNKRFPNFIIVNKAVSKNIRKVWFISDWNYGEIADTDFLNKIVSNLKAKGIPAAVYGWRKPYYVALQDSKLAENDLLVEIVGGADAGAIKEKAGAWYKGIKGNRKDILVFMDTATKITGLSFLPRAHDDNYSPPDFKGINNPDKFLLNNGYPYIEGVKLSEINRVVTFIMDYVYY